MNIYPANLSELMDMFPNEESCLEYLSLIRWPNGYSCIRCNSKDVFKVSRGLYRCRECKYDGSVISNTLFQNTHKPLRLWFQVIWYIVNQKNGVSALGLQKALGLGSYHTAWEWLHKLRRAMVRPNRDKLSGLVEVNEAFIGGGRTGKRGRGSTGKSLVLIAAERRNTGIGRIRLSLIKNVSNSVLLNAIEKMILAGSQICTDGLNSYRGLNEHGYIHLPIVNKNVKDEDAIEKAHLVASLLKRWLVGTHQGAISHKHLPYYLDEFTFRFNRRKSRSRGKLFHQLIQQSLQIDPIPIKSLTTTSCG